MKKFWILPVAVFAMFFIVSCGSENKNESEPQQQEEESAFKAVDVGECRHSEPPISFRDRIYTEKENEFSCNEYVEVTEKKENVIKFNWFGEMHCGIDWEYGYKVEGIENNVLKVSILERDTDLDTDALCDECCYLMPIEYTASTTEEIDSIKAIEINYEGKNHKVTFQINEETTEEPSNPERPAEEVTAQCEYDGQTGYESGDIVLSFDSCKPLTCKNGIFEGYDGDFCDGCRYWNDPDKEGLPGEMMKFSCNGAAERDWCECVKDDSGAKKWACYYSHECQCIYYEDGKRYDLGYKIATDFCQTSTCSDGSFTFLDWEACDHCYYSVFDDPEHTDNNAVIGDKYDFTCPDGSKVDWCECVADDKDIFGQKWKCADRVDLNCPKE